LSTLDYLEHSKEEALDLAVKNNNGIIKIVPENEYEQSDHEETSQMTKSSSVCLGDLQEEEFL